jgi:hypothetical protein
MNTEDTNRLNMISAVITYCLANVAATAGIPMFAGLLTAVQNRVALINGFNIVGGGTSTGVTLDTGALRKTMESIAYKCASATLAFANSTNNNTLKALVNLTESKLDRAKIQDIDDVCEGIGNAATANLVGAMSFGLLASDPTDLTAAIALYRIASADPRQTVITMNLAKQNAIDMVRSIIADLFKAQMDPAVNTLKLTNNNFWTGYFKAREIINLGAPKKKVA